LSCQFCRKLAGDYKAAIELKKSCPVEQAPKSVAGKLPGDSKPVKKGKTKADVSRADASANWRVKSQCVFKSVELRRSELKTLLAPTLETSGSYKQYLEDFQVFVVFKREAEAKLEHEEDKRKKAAIMSKPKKSEEKKAVEKVVDAKAEEAKAKTKTSQKKAAKKAKDARRKMRKSLKVLEAEKLELALIKTSKAIERESSKKVKSARDGSAVKSTKVAGGKADEPLTQKSDEERKRKLKLNQKKRQRQKRAKAAKAS